jgi:hypothetical protein
MGPLIRDHKPGPRFCCKNALRSALKLVLRSHLLRRLMLAHSACGKPRSPFSQVWKSKFIEHMRGRGV